MKKKLYYIANARIPTQRAHGLQIVKMCEAFAGAGMDVELIIPGRQNELRDDAYTYYGANPVFSIKKLFCLDLAPRMEPAPRIFHWLRSLSFTCSLALYLAFKKDGYVYFRYDEPLLALLTGFFKNRNVTCEAHFLIEGWQRKAMLGLDNVIVVNAAAQQEYEKDVFDKKILVAPDGVSAGGINSSKEEARALLGMTADKKIIIYTGYFYEWKGIDTLIRSMRLFQDDKVELWLVGGAAEDTARVRRIIEDLKLSNVRLIGYKPYKEALLYQRAADCVVVTGTNAHQESKLFTSPLKLFEYMASGTPIVASATPALQEIVADGKSAVLVEPDNEQAMHAGIRFVLDNHDTAALYAARAKQEVAQYDWSVRARHILEFIKAREVMPKVLYVFAGARNWFMEAFKKGEVADSQLIGLNHLADFGIRPAFAENRIMNMLRRVNFHLAQIPLLWLLPRYDVVFFGSNLPFVFFIKKILRLQRPRIVLYNTFFTNALKRNRSGMGRYVIKEAIQAADAVVCPSSAQKEFLEQEECGDNAYVILNGVDADFFRPGNAALHSRPSYAASIGKDNGRDYATLIQAACGMRKEFRIVAVPRNFQGIKDVPANVHVLYDLPQKETAALLAGADCAIIPTRKETYLDASDCSGQYVVLEAMAAGKAVIASERSTLGDYLRNGENGLVIEAENAQSLMEAVELLEYDPKLRAALGVAARKSVENHFTTRRLAKDLAALFRGIMQEI